MHAIRILAAITAEVHPATNQLSRSNEVVSKAGPVISCTPNGTAPRLVGVNTALELLVHQHIVQHKHEQGDAAHRHEQVHEAGPEFFYAEPSFCAWMTS